MFLSDLDIGETAVISKVLGRGAFRKRITEMGFIKGNKVTLIRKAPLSDPIEYKILGYEISLRVSEARMIEIVTVSEAKNMFSANFNGVVTESLLKKAAFEKSKIINVALIGNPNSGKTTLFNYASNSHERVGNYSGVTVESKTAQFKHKGYTICITDLPGTYSISAYSPDELYVRNYIINERPDVVINVIDASNLERNLYLTTQLIDMDIKIIASLNMYDDLQKRNDKFDYKSLGAMLGISFVPTISPKGIGIRELFEKVIEIHTDKDTIYRHIHINFGEEIEESVRKIQFFVKQNYDTITKISSRFIAIKLLENDKESRKIIENCENHNDIINEAEKEIRRIELLIGNDTETLIADARYGFISGALKETFIKGTEERHRKTQMIDAVMTNKIIGFPLFFSFLWFMFYITFKLGEYPKQWLEQLVASVGKLIDYFIPGGQLNDLLTGGIISGVGGVIVFLPNILLLFFFISLMEDTGYMARVAFIMDKLMHRIGLHGKSFISLIMGFGCNVPAIMSTRTIENRNNRILTILINPFMSCSARLPIYVLFVSAFFKNNASTALFLIYTAGIFIAITVPIIFKKTLFKGTEIPFVMELPPYRIPTLRSLIKHIWRKGEQYLKKMGGVILIASIIIWALGYFPLNINYSKDYTKLINDLKSNYDKRINNINNADLKLKIEKQKEEAVARLELEQKSEHMEKSYIGSIGRAIEPVMKPLGFDWRMSISLLTGIAAKEVVVSTLGVLYQSNPSDPTGKSSLQEKLREQKFEYGPDKGKLVFTTLTVICFLLFVLIYFPCVAVMAAIKRETGNWKWTVFVISYTTILAWLVAFTVNQSAILLMKL